MPRKTTFEGDQGDVEFVPSPVLVDAMNEGEGAGTPPVEPPPFELSAVPASDALLADPAADAPPPERYRELRPWNRETLAQRLNEAAADGWRLAAVVGYQIILERETTLEAVLGRINE